MLGRRRAVRKEHRMLARAFLSQVTSDVLTRNLRDPEGRILIEWLVDRAEELAEADDACAEQEVQRLCRRARAIACFVNLWCYRNDWGAAGQLAAAEHFPFPLPTRAQEPCELMQVIVNWETVRIQVASRAA
jgi:hypothetical protein